MQSFHLQCEILPKNKNKIAEQKQADLWAWDQPFPQFKFLDSHGYTLKNKKKKKNKQSNNLKKEKEEERNRKKKKGQN